MSTTGTIHLTTATLERLLRPILPLVDREDTMPILNAVWLRTTRDTVLAAGTDRYRLGVQRVTPVKPVRAHLRAALPLEAARHILETFRGVGRRGRHRQEFPVTLAVRGEHLEVRGPSPVGGDLTAVYHLIPAPANPPALGAVFRAATLPADRPVPIVAVAWPMLAGFEAAVRWNDREPLRLLPQVGDGVRPAPIGVQAGEDFRGAVMPMTGPTSSEPAPGTESWAELLEVFAR